MFPTRVSMPCKKVLRNHRCCRKFVLIEKLPYAAGPRTFEDVASRIDKSHDRKIVIKSNHAQYLEPYTTT